MPLMNSQYDAIMRMYSSRQAAARQALEERLEKIHAEIPDLGEVEDGIVALRASLVRQAVQEDARETAGGSDCLTASAVSAQKAKLEDLISKRDSLLASHGYSLTDLEPVYTCPDCHDTGYVDGVKCHCFIQAGIDLIYQQSALKDVLERENFNTFSYKWYEGEDLEVMRQNVAAARLFIENFDTSFQNLLLMGNVGTGKTFLTNCIAKELIDSCHSVVYLTAFSLFDELSKSAFGSKTGESREARSYILDSDLLIIDDLGCELSNSFTVSQFFLCVNERILRRKSTIISTNLDMEGLRSVYTERTLSRIISSYNIRKLPGGDIRIKKQLNIS